jgi:hypothetical protein
MIKVSNLFFNIVKYVIEPHGYFFEPCPYFFNYHVEYF